MACPSPPSRGAARIYLRQVGSRTGVRVVAELPDVGLEHGTMLGQRELVRHRLRLRAETKRCGRGRVSRDGAWKLYYGGKVTKVHIYI